MPPEVVPATVIFFYFAGVGGPPPPPVLVFGSLPEPWIEGELVLTGGIVLGG